MGKQSPVITGGVTSATAFLVQIIAWLATLFHVSIPDGVQLALAVGIVTATHWLVNLFIAKNPCACPKA